MEQQLEHSSARTLRSEREALTAWMARLEARSPQDDRSYERWLQLRRIVGKLDNQLRLLRDLYGN
jgi:hypothetical protein